MIPKPGEEYDPKLLTPQINKNFRGFHTVKNIKEQYKFVKQLGAGSYGTVFEAVHIQSNEPCAVKVIQKKKTNQGWHGLMKKELQALEHLTHPNIVRVLDLCEDTRFIYIIAELMPHGDMYKLAIDMAKNHKPISEGEVAEWMLQLLQALNYLHTLKVIHRDLKLENILIDKTEDGEVRCKLTDFGFAHFMQEEEASM